MIKVVQKSNNLTLDFNAPNGEQLSREHLSKMFGGDTGCMCKKAPFSVCKCEGPDIIYEIVR